MLKVAIRVHDRCPKTASLLLLTVSQPQLVVGPSDVAQACHSPEPFPDLAIWMPSDRGALFSRLYVVSRTDHEEAVRNPIPVMV